MKLRILRVEDQYARESLSIEVGRSFESDKVCQILEQMFRYIEREAVANGHAESFHARLRDGFLNGEVFLSVLDAQVKLAIWRQHFNHERLHSSLGYKTPIAFAALFCHEWGSDRPLGASPE